jgi:hypothetical protein
MGTLGDLKARIARELDRDDMGSGGALEATLAAAIASAVQHWKGRAYSNATDGVPATDGDSNAWTTERADLIAARSKVILLRGALRDFDAAPVAVSEEEDAAIGLLGVGFLRDERNWGRS